MGIGASITLIALGAIMAFGIRDNLSFIDLGNIGVILMVCGAIGLAVTVLVWGPRSRTRPPIAAEDELVDEPRVVPRRRRW